MYLVYINKVGTNYRFEDLYEFIFSDTTNNIDGEDWDVFPASGRPSPPSKQFIKLVGRLESKLKLDVVQNSTVFAVWDAVDGVIALAWENIDAYESYPDKRLCFTFGENLESVKNKLYEKDLILKFKDEDEK